MEYQAARTEVQSPPPRVSLSAAAIEACAMCLIAVLLVWLI